MSFLRTALQCGLRGFALDPRSRLHGVPHWVRVWNNARQLAPMVPGVDDHADLRLCAWFAFLHDCRRIDDGADPRHGARAAEYAKQLWLAGTIGLDGERMFQLQCALQGHSAGWCVEAPAVLVCWDADRLELIRCGTQPDPRRMCTQAGAAAARALPRIQPRKRKMNR